MASVTGKESIPREIPTPLLLDTSCNPSEASILVITEYTKKVLGAKSHSYNSNTVSIFLYAKLSPRFEIRSGGLFRKIIPASCSNPSLLSPKSAPH